jgi:hypothetical protein
MKVVLGENGHEAEICQRSMEVDAAHEPHASDLAKVSFWRSERVKLVTPLEPAFTLPLQVAVLKNQGAVALRTAMRGTKPFRRADETAQNQRGLNRVSPDTVNHRCSLHPTRTHRKAMSDAVEKIVDTYVLLNGSDALGDLRYRQIGGPSKSSYGPRFQFADQSDRWKLP